MIDTAARLILSPLLITQALRVRRIAQSLAEPPGARSGTVGSGPPLRLGIIGDSSGAGVGATHQSEALSGQLTEALGADFEVTWHLDAVTGATTASTLARLRDATPEKRDVIVIALGTNDITRLVPAQVWLRRQAALLERLHQLYAPRQFYISGLPPIAHFPLLPEPLRWTLGRHAARLEARRIRWLRTRADCTHAPFDLPLDPALMASDGFHPSPKLYAIWGKEMASRIKNDWPKISE